MDKIKNAVKDMATGLPMAVAMLVVTFAAVKLVAWAAEKVKPGAGEKVRGLVRA
jgi:hypothetical protein